MNGSLRLQLRIIAVVLVAISVIRPVGYVHALQALGDAAPAGSTGSLSATLRFSYEFILHALCAWGLLNSRSWARWVAAVLTSELAVVNVAKLPALWAEPPMNFPQWEWVQWGAVAMALVFGYFTWVLLAPKTAKFFDRRR